MKQEHERRVDAARSPQRRHREQLEIRYATIIDEWARRIHLDSWEGRMSRLVSDGVMSEETFDELPRLSDWLLRRVWPRALPDLEAALQNFRFIAQDLEAVVAWSESRRSGQVLVDRVYAESIYDEDTYKFLRRRSDYYRDLAADLAIELTRAVNLVADRVREHLWPSYRLSEGYAIVGLGLNADLSYQTLRPLYALDAPPQPYPGLQRFLMERGSRDYAVGEGGPPDGTAMPAMRISGQRGGDGDA